MTTAHNAKDHSGQRFGRLVAIKRVGSKGNNAIWLCACDCGNTSHALSGNLSSGNSTTCGCGRGRTLPKGQAALNRIFDVYFYAARRRKIEFSLRLSQLEGLIKSRCFYCNAEPSRRYSPALVKNGECIANGIDRLDNTLGYIAGNCVPCCTACNLAKGTRTVKEFAEWIKRVSPWAEGVA